jgi:hypothetical protein
MPVERPGVMCQSSMGERSDHLLVSRNPSKIAPGSVAGVWAYLPTTYRTSIIYIAYLPVDDDVDCDVRLATRGWFNPRASISFHPMSSIPRYVSRAMTANENKTWRSAYQAVRSTEQAMDASCVVLCSTTACQVQCLHTYINMTAAHCTHIYTATLEPARGPENATPQLGMCILCTVASYCIRCQSISDVAYTTTSYIQVGSIVAPTHTR